MVPPKRGKGEHWSRPRRWAWRAWVWWELWARDLIVVVAIALSLWSSVITQRTLTKGQNETHERVNETCRISETKQAADVSALRRTYEYLGGLSARQLAQPLNKAVLAGLPETIREAQTDDAPAYCDEPNVGLPEPDPPVPPRPPTLPTP